MIKWFIFSLQKLIKDEQTEEEIHYRTGRQKLKNQTPSGPIDSMDYISSTSSTRRQ